MKNYLLALTAMTSLVLVQMANAQQSLTSPKELPPANFSGTQYVDSTGCIFIRAGQAGATSWVPRVSRDRKQLCGHQPTFPGQAGLSADAEVAQSSSVQVITGVSTAATPTVVATAPVGSGGQTSTAPTSQTRILPAHLFEKRQLERTVKTPKGYRPAWQDGRLNLRRAEQTLAGQEEMRRIWTDTVPRRLID